tara:strand:+ start:4888 stop:6015 length:1128 start_codon:yes stop_codon:yes gene_type:complete
MESVARKTGFAKYPTYKDSGVEWLGEIPVSWEFTRMKRLYRDYSKKNLPEAELLSVTQNQGVVPRTWVENRMVMPSGALESFKFINKGDFAISLRSFEGGLEYCHHDGILSPAYTVLKKRRNDLNESFYKYLFKSYSFISELQTSIVGIREGKNISYPELSYSFLPVPSQGEQNAIAKFLDDKTAKIDQAIAKKEKLIALLKERKQIIIQNAVSKGLDPLAKMKDSGVEWIGEIPEGWEVKRLKSEIDLLTGYPFPSSQYTEAGIKLARGINVKEGTFNWKDLRYWPEITKDLEKYKLVDGDVLIAMDGSKVGKNFCQVKSSDLPILLLQRVARLRPLGSLERSYLYWNIANKSFLNWVNMSKQILWCLILLQKI